MLALTRRDGPRPLRTAHCSSMTEQPAPGRLPRRRRSTPARARYFLAVLRPRFTGDCVDNDEGTQGFHDAVRLGSRTTAYSCNHDGAADDDRTRRKKPLPENRSRSAARVVRLAKPHGVPALATILVGFHSASATDVNTKGAAAGASASNSCPSSCRKAQLRRNRWPRSMRGTPIRACAEFSSTSVPAHIHERAGFDRIDLAKDVDGVTALGFGRMALHCRDRASRCWQGSLRS